MSFEAGQNPVFDHLIKLVPQLRDDVDVRHQFAICGGKMLFGTQSPYDLDEVETFLLGFLRASEFAML